MPVIETQKLSKSYGSIQALKEVSLSVEPGEIYGLLGQNGAGKTTLIKILLGIARRWEGNAFLLGNRAGSVNQRQFVGYLPEDHRFPGYHSAFSLLDFYGMIYGISRGERRKKIDNILELVGLKERSRYKIRTYSKGMKQRVGIAQALFHDPRLIFLDEPTDGVDPIGRRHIRGMLQKLKAEGKTIFLNSHLLGEVELVCDRVGILSRGEMIREGDIESLTREANFYHLQVAPGQTFPQEELAQQGYSFEFKQPFWEIVLEDPNGIDVVVDFLRTRGFSIRHLVEKRQTLEDLFMKALEEPTLFPQARN